MSARSKLPFSTKIGAKRARGRTEPSHQITETTERVESTSLPEASRSCTAWWVIRRCGLLAKLKTPDGRSWDWTQIPFWKIANWIELITWSRSFHTRTRDCDRESY